MDLKRMAIALMGIEEPQNAGKLNGKCTRKAESMVTTFRISERKTASPMQWHGYMAGSRAILGTVYPVCVRVLKKLPYVI